MRYADDIELEGEPLGRPLHTAKDQRRTLLGLEMRVGGFKNIQAIYIDSRVQRDVILLGPCETGSSSLLEGELMMHPDDAAIFADLTRKTAPESMIHIPPNSSKEQLMSGDIEHKLFAVKREEWFVPTGTYHDQFGADWTDLMKAISWATHRLEKLGKFDGNGEPASDLIKVVPHDEHVVVRIEYTEEQK
jgi:hypothetical protein